MRWLLWYAGRRAGPAGKLPRDVGALYFGALTEVLRAGLELRDDAEVAATGSLVRGMGRLQAVLWYVKPKSDQAMQAVAKMLAQTREQNAPASQPGPLS